MAPSHYLNQFWILKIRPIPINFSEIFSEIQSFPLKKIHLKMWYVNSCPFRLGLNVLNDVIRTVQMYSQIHDDVIKWKHFSRYWPFVWGIHWSPMNSPHKGQWHGTLMFSLICAWINGWVNKNRNHYKNVSLCGHCCACWWLGTDRYQDIYSDWVLCMFKSSTWG